MMKPPAAKLFRRFLIRLWTLELRKLLVILQGKAALPDRAALDVQIERLDHEGEATLFS